MKQRLAILFLVAAVVAAADLVTKEWAHRTIPLGGERRVNSFLNWKTSRNTGAAFGLLGDDRWRTAREEEWTKARVFLVVVSVAAAFFLVWLAVRTEERPLWTAIALGLVLGGVIGNLYDRISEPWGGVRDFIDFHIGDWHWHTFNIADSGISVGVILLLILGFLPRQKRERGPEMVTSRR